MSKKTLRQLLERSQSRIVGRWFAEIVQSYPGEAARYFGDNKDRFRNPIGVNTRESMDIIYGELVNDGDSEDLVEALDRIIRIRSIQDFSPSQAVAFVYSLKGII